jgi:hypothetical protein
MHISGTAFSNKSYSLVVSFFEQKVNGILERAGVFRAILGLHKAFNLTIRVGANKS